MTEDMQQENDSVRILKISCHSCMQKLDVTSLQPFSRIQCPTCSAELIVPAWFDDYLLEEPSGTGGMATVYRALDPALDREVAIKVLKPELSHDAGKSQLFLHEARTAATINHYAIVPIYTCGVYREHTYIIMQYMGGGSLEKQLRQSPEPLPMEKVLRWMHDIAEGLENARTHGVIHHDIKPGNILLDNEGSAKIGDFGIAQIVTGNRQDTESVSRNWVSPHYVSPEKVRTGEEGVPGDIYSLGATFYHLVTGMTPFDHDDIEELIRMRLTGDPTPPHVLRKEIRVEISQLIMSMMDRDPEKRPSYKTIISTLNRVIKEISASTVPLPVRSIRKKHAAAETPEQTGKSRLLLIVAGVLLFVLAGTGTAAWLLGAFSPEKTQSQAQAEDDSALMNGAVYAFAAGDPAAASAYADQVMQNAKASVKVRLTSLFQYACGLYLAEDMDLGKLSEKRKELEKQLQGKNIVPYADILTVVRFLENPESNEKAKTPEYALWQKMAEFLAACRENKEDSGLVPLIAGLETQEPAWFRKAWSSRLDVWKKAIADGKGHTNRIEPLFADLIQEGSVLRDYMTIREFLAGKKIPSTRNQTELTAEELELAVQKYKDAKRPLPKAPYLLSTSEHTDYLDKLQKAERESEKLRLELMKNLIPFLAHSSIQRPYSTDSFATLDKRRFANGTLYMNPEYTLYYTARGCSRIDWEQIPVQELSSILIDNIVYLSDAETSGASPEEISFACLRYALFLQWYGDYERAAKYARQALEADSSAKNTAFIKYMLLF